MSSSDFSQSDIEDFDDLANSPLSSPPTRATADPFNVHPVDITSHLMSSLTKLSDISSDKKVDGQLRPTTAERNGAILASDLSSTYEKHDRFYFDDGIITFLVENVLCGVHRYFFCRDSSYFVDLIMDRLIPKDGNSIPFSKPVVLNDVKGSEFDALLCILYPLNFDECELKTVESWTAVLRLATKWSLSSIRKLAISRLEPIASPVDKATLGRTYCVDAWLLPGFTAICQRSQPLTRDEGRRLGVDDAVLVAYLRESALACSTKLKAFDISTMVQACLASPDIVDESVIHITVPKAPAAQGTLSAKSSRTPSTDPKPKLSQPKPAQAPSSKDTDSGSSSLSLSKNSTEAFGNINIGSESLNTPEIVPIASPPEFHSNPSKSQQGDADGPSQAGLGTSISKTGAHTAKNVQSNPWSRQPKWGKAL